MIRIIDMRESEREYIKKKYSSKLDFIDLEARNAFSTKKFTLLFIKCVYRYNHYGIRNIIINNSMVGNDYPRCSKVKTRKNIA